MSDSGIGRRAPGQRVVRERWYYCAICDLPMPESETTIPTWPHPQADLRVCADDLDEPDYLMNTILSPPMTGHDEEYN
jgi:hypothetical protein